MPRHTPAAALALFTTLVAMPIAMRGPEHIALLSHLWQARSAPIDVAARLASAGVPGQTERLMPWEEPLFAVVDGVAYFSIIGPIIKGYDDFDAWWYGCASIDRIQRELVEIENLHQSGTIKAVVFLINSPGGSAMGTPELAAQIVALGEKLLTVAFTSDLACSAAYWIACACRLVVCTPSAMVGSIGTYLALYDYTEMLKEWGVKLEMFRAGDLKGIGVPGKEFTDEERTFLKNSVNRINARFTGHVRARRGTVADSTMQGQWFDGEEAQTLGLVDRVVAGLPELVAAVHDEVG